MRKLVSGIVVALLATACTGDGRSVTAPLVMPVHIVTRPSPATSFIKVQAGAVQALIPDRWHPVPAGGHGSQNGFAGRDAMP